MSYRETYNQLVIRGARLMIQKTAHGRGNWQLGATKGKGAGKNSLRVPTVQVVDSKITFASPKAPVRRADIMRLQLDGLGAEPLVLQAELTVNQTPLTLSARAGAADAPTGARWLALPGTGAERRHPRRAEWQRPGAVRSHRARCQTLGAGANGKSFRTNRRDQWAAGGAFRLETGLSWDDQTLKATAINGSSETDVLPAPLPVSDGEISVPLDGPWFVRMTGKLGDRPGTLQLTPIAVPKASDQTAGTQTTGVQATGAVAIKATLAEGRFGGELQPASGDALALLSGKLNVGTVTFGGWRAG